MRYFPIYLDLRNQPVLVVGGGRVAEGKIEQLLEAGARIRLVSPALTARLRELAGDGRLDYRCAEFSEADLAGQLVVVCATNDQAVNESVARAAQARRMLCNVVDQPALCNFITPALVTRGDLQISISTGGGSPSLAQRVKREVGELIGDEYGELLELAAELRIAAHRAIPDFEGRRRLLQAFVESEALELLRAGKRAAARQIGLTLLEQASP